MNTAGLGKIFNVLDEKKHIYQLICMMANDDEIRPTVKMCIESTIEKFNGRFIECYSGDRWNINQDTHIIGNYHSFRFEISSAIVEDLCGHIQWICRRLDYKFYLQDKGEKK